MIYCKNSKKCFKEAEKYILGGVNSPVRAFKSVGGTPVFIKKAAGSAIYDVDHNKYIDFVMSWGVGILGHAPRKVIARVETFLKKGISYGAPTVSETELAKLICSAIPSIEKIRFVNSGTESCMSAIRLARGATNKEKIIKFAGCYHGHSDSLLTKSGSGIATFGIQGSAGVPKDFVKNTIVLPYNNLEIFEEAVRKDHKQIACVIIEPVAANMGLVLPKKEFLEGLREMCTRYKIILIFDEVITGFRLLFGGAQKHYGIKPDITCLGKIIGGGFPIGAFGGKKEIMEHLAPIGDVYQAGTLSGNPIAVNAGIETLKLLKNADYDLLAKKTGLLCEKLNTYLSKTAKPIKINAIGSLFTIFFNHHKNIGNYEDASASNTKNYAKFFHSLLKNGVYFPPSQFETCFVSMAHSEKDIEKTVSAAIHAFEKII